jgi:uncharacterized DUF497 family protein
MALTFEWDEEKAQANVHKHGVSFEEAKTVFNDPLAMTISDPDHSCQEDRYIDLGLSVRGRILMVWYTERRGNIRIIGSRKATRGQRRWYEEGH